jgi:hypothetical protein
MMRYEEELKQVTDQPLIQLFAEYLLLQLRQAEAVPLPEEDEEF